MAIYIARRELLATLLDGAVAWPLGVRAQQPEQMRRIGVLMLHPKNVRKDSCGPRRSGK